MAANVKTSIENDRRRDDPVGRERVVFFSDAVYAIAITLLALDIRLPTSSTVTASDAVLTRNLLELWPTYLSYVLSFLVIGNFWIAHHARVGMIVRYDTNFLILTCSTSWRLRSFPFRRPCSARTETVPRPSSPPWRSS